MFRDSNRLLHNQMIIRQRKTDSSNDGDGDGDGLHVKYLLALGCAYVYTILTLGLLSQLNMMEEGIKFLN